MAWGDNGVTIARQLLDQQVAVTGWGATGLRIPFKALRTAGYLRKLRLFSPATTHTITHGTGTNQIPAQLQLPPFRVLNRVQLVMQGIAMVYDIQGIDLPFLRVMNAGIWNNDSAGYLYDVVAGSSSVMSGSGNNKTNNYMSTSVFTSNTSVVLTFFGEMPITEVITFRDSVISQKQGSVVIADKPLEVGLLTLQNTQSNVLPQVTLNAASAGSTSIPDALVQLTGNDTVTTATASWNISSDLFDVPDDQTQRPLPFQQLFVITRSTFDTTISSNKAVVNFRPAGFLTKCHYMVVDSNNNIVDVSTLPTASLDFKWGATVDKFNETVQENLSRQLDRCVGVPPAGCLYHDFHWYDGTSTDFVNTAVLPNVRTEFSGLSSGATIHTCETRMIPVKVS